MISLSVQKRSALLLLILLLCSNIAFGALNITLARTKVSPSQPFDGILNLTFSEPLSKDTLLTFVILNTRPNITLSTALQTINHQLVPATYGKNGAPTAAASITFSQAGSSLVYALDLSDGGITDTSAISEIRSFNVTIQGEPLNNNYPTTPRIDISNDQQYEYTYKGSELTTYTDLNKSYLGTQPPSSTVRITGTLTDMFCQEVQLEPANTYRLSAKIKKLETTKNLTAALSLNLPSSSEEQLLCTPESPCCEITTTSTTALSDASCTVTKDINTRTTGYFCLFIKNGDETVEYYDLAKKPGDWNSRGYIGGSASRADYYIWGASRDYEKELKTSVRTTISDLASQSIRDYLATCGQSSCILVPLNISSSSPGKVTLKDLELKYRAAGIQTLIAFTPITYFPERIAALSTTIDLSVLSTILSPTDLGTSREMYVLFNNERSNTVRFDVVPGPKAVIKKDKAVVRVNEPLTLDASQSTPINTSIQSYTWAFGDTPNKGTGKTTTHAYAKAGFYTITLKVVDAQDLAGIATTLVEVTGGEENTTTKIARLENQITTLRTKINKEPRLQTTATLLSIPTLLDDAQTNLTILKNSNVSNSLFASRLDQLLATTPSDLSILNSIAYDPRLTRIEDVPTVLNTESVENFAEKILQVQTKTTIKADAYLVRLITGTQDETFILVTKSISGQAGHVYEILPSGITQKQQLSTIAEAVSPTLFRSATQTITYTLEGTTFAEITKALQTKTFVVPGDLSNIPLDTPHATLTEGFECGNNMCEEGETTQLCPQDCTADRPYTLLIILGSTALLVLAYIFLYKGKYNFNDVFAGKNKKNGARSLFPTERDYLSLKNYITSALHKGFTEEQISFALKKKGWTGPQVTGVLKDVKTIKKK